MSQELSGGRSDEVWKVMVSESPLRSLKTYIYKYIE